MEITNLDQLDLNKTYTYADYLLWKFKERVELFRGKIFKMSPAPARIHQKSFAECNENFRFFFSKKSLRIVCCAIRCPPSQIKMVRL